MPNLPFRPLAVYLIRRTIVLALLCMTTVVAFHAVLRFMQHQESFGKLVDDIGRTSVPLLAVSLWDIEPGALRLQLEILAQRDEIGYVRLVAATGQHFAAGDERLREAPVTRQLSIRKPQGTEEIGKLEIVGDPDFLYRAILSDTIGVLVSDGAFTLLACVLIAVMLRKDLQVPLERIARFASELKPQQLMTPLELPRARRSPYTDEIDLVADGFRKLQTGLREHIADLDRLVAERTQQLESVMTELRELNRIDALTNCFNRRELESRLPAEAERAQRYGRPLSLVFFDIDHFKRVNDRYGHAGGDAVLAGVAALCRAEMRSSVDWIARYGGEEFLIVLPETDLASATAIAERLRRLIASLEVPWDGEHIRVTASFGVAQCRSEEGSAALLRRTDELLYQAKSQGRNRVVSAPAQFRTAPSTSGPTSASSAHSAAQQQQQQQQASVWPGS